MSARRAPPVDVAPPRPIREGVAEGRGTGVADRRAARRLGVTAAATVAVALALGALWPRPEPAAAGGHSSSFGAGPLDHRLLLGVLESLGYAAGRHAQSYARLDAPAATTLVTIDPLPLEALAEVPATAIDTAQRRALDDFVRGGGTWVATARSAIRVTALGAELARLDAGGFDADHVATTLCTPPPLREIPAVGRLRGEGPLAALRLDLTATAKLAAMLPGIANAADEPANAPPPGRPPGPAPAPTIPAFGALGDDWTPWLSLDGAPLVVVRQLGAGRVILVSTPLPFTHYGLVALGLHEATLALLHAASDRGTRRLAFDAFAQGHVTARGVWWWAREKGLLHGLQAGLLLLAVLAWRAAVRPRPPLAVDDRPRRALAEFVAAQADLARRSGDHRRSLDRLRRALLDRAARRGDRDAARRIAAVAVPARALDAATFASAARALHDAARRSPHAPD